MGHIRKLIFNSNNEKMIASFTTYKKEKLMGIDDRIKVIMQKMDKLKGKNRKITCGEFPPRWEATLTEQVVADYEAEHKITLPNDYRRFITTVAAGGTQPFYGMYSLTWCVREYELRADVKEKFPYTVRKPLNVYELTDEEYADLYDRNEPNVDVGYIPLCHEGDGMYSILIVNTDDEETYGTVWYYDLCNDAGIYPLIHPNTKQTMNFLDWLEYYVDRTLELDDEDYFGYAELTGVLE